jgi:threonine dehydrogenase-like Zn-dependent dehydrogenase
LLDKGWSPQDAMLAGCLLEPIGCVYNALFVHGRGLRPGESVTVHGLGPLGLFAGALARIAGASRVIGIDPCAERREFAAGLGFDACVEPVADVLPAEIPELTADVHIEASGNPAATLRVIERSLRPGARCLLVSRTDAPSAIDTNPWVSAAAQLIFARGHSGGIFPYIIRLFAAGRLAAGDLIGETIGLDDLPSVLALGFGTSPGKTIVLVGNDERRTTPDRLLR